MSAHTATVTWERTPHPEITGDYSRDHHWAFDGGLTVGASSAPSFAGNPALVDPEEALIASVASCHMLWFLHLAARAGHEVARYGDEPNGTMERDSRGRVSITRIDLRPIVEWAGDQAPKDDVVKQLHVTAHEKCFIANSLRSEITLHGSELESPE